MFHTGVLPDIYHIWLYFAKAFYCVTLEVGASWTPFFCGTSSKENAKGWLPSWIRHRLVETWAKKSQNVHRPFSISKIVHRSCYSTSVAHHFGWLAGRKLVTQRRTTGQPGFIAFQSMRPGATWRLTCCPCCKSFLPVPNLLPCLWTRHCQCFCWPLSPCLSLESAVWKGSMQSI